MDLFGILFEGFLGNVFGNPIFLGVFVLLFIAVILFLSNASKILVTPLLLIFSYGLVQYGLIPTALFGGMILITGLVFVLVILNALFGQ